MKIELLEDKNIFNPPGKVTKSHLELYKLLKYRHKNNQQFTKEDLIKIYKKFVKQNKHLDERNMEHSIEVRIYNNASYWMNHAIISLIRKGYVGLMFLEDL